MKLPRIGISAGFLHGDPRRPHIKNKMLLYLEQALSNWVLTQPALVYLIPSVPMHSEIKLTQLAEILDGLVLQGGADMAPEAYGETALNPDWKGDAVRDEYELALFDAFYSQGKPILGVCRGAQLINVALGGSLYQDITTMVPNASKHRDPEIYDQNFHTICFEPDSLLAQLYPDQCSGKINSVHHQAVKRLANDLLIEAHSESDGIIEAFRYTREPFIYGVQWHPEFHAHHDTTLLDGAPLLHRFLAEAQKRAAC